MEFKNKTILSCFISIFLISGCSINNSGFEKYDEKKLVDLYPVNSTYKIQTDWWKNYNDQGLNNLIDLALKNNIDLAKSAITSNIALYNANLIGADLIPTFSSSLGASAQKNIKTGGNSTQSFNGSVGISYELDLWKKLSDSKNAKEWEYNATKEDIEDAKLVLINNVVDGYFHLKYLNESLSITQRSLNNYQKILDISNQKFKVGVVGNLDVLQAQQSVQSSVNSINTLNIQIKEVQNTIKNLVNIQPGTTFTVSNEKLLDIPLQKVNINIPVSTIANRPDLRASEYRLMESFKNKTAIEKNIYPDITISSTLSSSNDKFSSALNVPIAAANISINLPFLDWDRIKWNTKISQAEFEQNKLTFKENITTALNEIDSYYFSYQQNLKTFDTTQNQFNIAKKISFNYEQQYNAGISEMSDWLTALQSQYTTEQSVIQAKYTLLSGENNVYKAMAGRYNY